MASHYDAVQPGTPVLTYTISTDVVSAGVPASARGQVVTIDYPKDLKATYELTLSSAQSNTGTIVISSLEKYSTADAGLLLITGRKKAGTATAPIWIYVVWFDSQDRCLGVSAFIALTAAEYFDLGGGDRPIVDPRAIDVSFAAKFAIAVGTEIVDTFELLLKLY